MSEPEATIEKPLCFVVGPIGEAGTEIRKHADMVLNAIIKEVLEADEFGYEVRRADDDDRPGMISDRIIHDIINAELVVADLTDLNPNVFYELGIRHASSKPTIHIVKSGTKLPFDNAGHGTLFVDVTSWHDILAQRKKLALSAKAIKRDDYKVSNPITQANATFKLRESADPKDILITEVLDRVARLERRKPHHEVRSLRSITSPEMDIANNIAQHIALMMREGYQSKEIFNMLNDLGRAEGKYISMDFYDREQLIFTLGNSRVKIEEAGRMWHTGTPEDITAP